MDSWSTTLVSLAWLLALFIIHPVYGMPSLRMRDSCLRVSPELDQFRIQGEAVVLGCPWLQRFLSKNKLHTASAGYTYQVTKTGGVVGGGVAPEEEEQGRVLRHDGQLWLLPAQISDSGEYSCVYRNDSFCVAGSITLKVHENLFTDLDSVVFPISNPEGQNVSIQCPDIDQFNTTEDIDWYKDSSYTALPVGSGRYYRERQDLLLLTDVRQSDKGLYTCKLRVHVNNRQYDVSRTLQLQVEGLPSQTTQPGTPASDAADRTSQTTEHSVPLQSPKIISPVNGTVFESPEGSGLAMVCKVLTNCQSVDSTVVTWLVNGQSVEVSYLDERALQGGRRVTRVAGGCHVEMRLVILALRREDVRTELACVSQNQGGGQQVFILLRLEDSASTWPAVAVVGSLCFLLVLVVLLYFLLRPRRKVDYFLARQNSSF